MTTIRFIRTIKSIKPTQLLHRLRLIIKRRLLVFFNNIISVDIKVPQKYEINNQINLHLPFCGVDEISINNNEIQIFLLNNYKTYYDKIIWQDDSLNVGTRLWKLHLHYFNYVHQLKNSDFERIINSWIEDCRPYSQDYYKDVWNSYSLSIRIVNWITFIRMNYGKFTKTFNEKINISLLKQYRFLVSNLELDIMGNHIVKNLLALYIFRNYFSSPVFISEIKLNNILLSVLDEQILKDGFHYELSPSYHNQVFYDLLSILCHVNDEKTKLILQEKLIKMWSIIDKFTFSNGDISLMNDGGLNMAPSKKWLSARLPINFDVQEHTSPFYDSSGFLSKKFKNGPELIYDYGEIGPKTLPAHAHGDIFSFELVYKKQSIIIDKGVYEYSAGVRRKNSRSTLEHNTLSIESQDQAEFWSAFRVGRRPKIKVEQKIEKSNFVSISASHDGFRHLSGRPIHSRSIEFDKDTFIIEDKVVSDCYVDWSINFLLHYQLKVTMAENNEFIFCLNGNTISMSSTAKNAAIVETVHWTDIGVEHTTKAIRLTGRSMNKTIKTIIKFH